MDFTNILKQLAREKEISESKAKLTWQVGCCVGPPSSCSLLGDLGSNVEDVGLSVLYVPLELYVCTGAAVTPCNTSSDSVC